MTHDDETRIPVVIGVGQINDRADSGAEGLDSLGLMAAAARAAGDDAGEGALARIDWLGIVSQISFPRYAGRLATLLSDALGLKPGRAHETPMPTGDSPVLLINQAANAIGRGEASVALIVGAEALRTASRRVAEAAAREGAPLAKSGPLGARKPAEPKMRHRYGLVSPTDIYPLYENAARPVYGQTLAEGQAETGVIWSALSEVAATNPAAWIHKARMPEEILAADADNRPIAFPYNKLMVANASVNQGAAVIVTSLAVARALNTPDERLIYVGRGAAAHEDDDPLVRPRFDQSVSMAVSLERALAFNALTVEDLDHVELYSCFPCVPKMARRILGWPAERPASVFGGLTFGGGPIGNYMTHAAASMVERLRREGVNGLLFANGGYATHNHTLLLTRRPQPAGTFPQDFDVQAEADRRRGALTPIDEAYAGPARIETYTVLYDREGAPRLGVVIGRADDGRRVIGRVPSTDAETIAFLTDGVTEPVGRRGLVVRDGETNRWIQALV
ncbi:acetyl-CoA acetyltransferase [Caulobacter vibrioides]|uniref:Acetyl-CoA acetyltransferase n=1 Tax=Caulobacter vibrioides OR37 TaxID=1292034 RepID=R0E9Q9_CAUVI|nr:acetyl-CoA acetyltransferase [Caulobacter vibrioides]ENZ82183.1 acetyl-CoA acetyltransferase [Caulobacter vibrioides OR37]